MPSSVTRGDEQANAVGRPFVHRDRDTRCLRGHHGEDLREIVDVVVAVDDLVAGVVAQRKFGIGQVTPVGCTRDEPPPMVIEVREEDRAPTGRPLRLVRFVGVVDPAVPVRVGPDPDLRVGCRHGITGRSR